MARERWFYAPTHKRQGPVPIAQLVEALLRLPDPRSCLVWKHSLPSWTPAGDVGEVDRHLAPFVAARRPAAPRVERAPDTTTDLDREVIAGAGRRPAARAQAVAGPSPLVYVGGGVGMLVLGVVVWMFWPKEPPKKMGAAAPGIITLKEGQGVAPGAGGGPAATATGGAAGSELPPVPSTAPASAGGSSAVPPPSVPPGTVPKSGTAPPAVPATQTASTPAPGPGGFAGWSDQEAQVPASELSKLRAVAGWSEKTLEVTVYNGSSWRITQLLVRPSRLINDNFVDDDKPLTMLPPGAGIDQGVDQLLSRVAPDRRKPGVNPLDTGKFVVEAGARPEAFRAPIIAAAGYPPR